MATDCTTSEALRIPLTEAARLKLDDYYQRMDNLLVYLGVADRLSFPRLEIIDEAFVLVSLHEAVRIFGSDDLPA
jgi:hypothetical protein